MLMNLVYAAIITVLELDLGVLELRALFKDRPIAILIGLVRFLSLSLGR